MATSNQVASVEAFVSSGAIPAIPDVACRGGHPGAARCSCAHEEDDKSDDDAERAAAAFRAIPNDAAPPMCDIFQKRASAKHPPKDPWGGCAAWFHDPDHQRDVGNISWGYLNMGTMRQHKSDAPHQTIQNQNMYEIM